MVAEKKRTETSSTAGIGMAVQIAEAHAMIAGAPTDELRLLLTLLWTTGGRITEVLGIRLMDVWPPDAIHMLNEKQHKKNASGYRPTEYKTVYLTESVVDQVLEYAKVHGLDRMDYLFPGRDPGRHLDRRTAWKHITRLSSNLRILRERPATEQHPPRIVPCYIHLFRHGTAVRLLQQGALLTTIQRQLGHKSVQTTSIYLDVSDESRRQDAKRVRF